MILASVILWKKFCYPNLQHITFHHSSTLLVFKTTLIFLLQEANDLINSEALRKIKLANKEYMEQQRREKERGRSHSFQLNR